MHPDQTTPNDHRYTPSDSAAARTPDQDQDAPAIAPDRDAAPAASEMPDGEARVAEAGHGYVGRTMDDALKTAPRVEEPGAGVDETPSDANDG